MAKARIVSVLMAFLFIAAGYTTAMGQEDSAKTATPQATTTDHAGHDASHNAAPPGDSQPAPAGHDMSQMSGMGDMNKHNEAMMKQMKTMRVQMEKIKATENPAERKRLLKEHMAGMKSGMKMMQEMDGKMMMKSGDSPMMKVMSSKEQGSMKGMPDDMAMCHQMMQQNAEMNHSMMEQIIESQEQLLDTTK